MGDTLFTALRTIVSLAAVFGALWWLHRRITKGKGRLGRTARLRSRAVEVVARQGLGPKAGVAVIDAGGRRYLLGVTEHAVTVLDRLDADPADDPLPAVTGRIPVPSAFERELATAVQHGEPTLTTVTAAVVVQQHTPEREPETIAILPAGPAYTTRRAARAAERATPREGLLPATAADTSAADETAQDEFLRRIAAVGGRPIPEPRREPVPVASPLAGSLLHPDTWRQTVAAIRRLR